MAHRRLLVVAFGAIVVLSVLAATGAAGGPTSVLEADTTSDELQGQDVLTPDIESDGDTEADVALTDQSVEQRALTLVTGHTVTVIGTGEDRRFEIEGPDGGDASYRTLSQGGDTYVLPRGVDTSVYSEALFNVDLLLEQGYTDRQVEGTPIVVTYENDQQFRTGDLEGFERTKTLEFIGATAGIATGDVDFTAANDFGGIDRISLDARHEVQLDEAADAIDAPAARDGFDVTGAGVRVAVLDTGIDADHPDFGDRVVDSVDFTGDGPGDRQGHGTHVAGIVAGDGTESGGDFVGIAPEAELMDVKVLDDAGGGTISAIVDGVDYAIDNDADIVSMSLGGPVQPNDPLVDAVEAAVNESVTVVVSAGNAGTDLRTISSPGNAEEAITVGATEEPYDEVAFFSSSGPTQIEQNIKPEVVAPGFPITAAGSDDAGEFPYTAKGGTSMSAPAVSGLSALLIEEHGDFEPGELEDRLVTTADPLPDFEGDIFRQGSGQVNATAALGGDVVIQNAVRSFGVIENPTQETAVFEVENEGNETVELDTDASVLNVESGETLENTAFNETTLTVEPGDTEAVELMVDIDDEFGPNSGVLTLEGERQSYRAIFGYSRGLEITVEKIENPRNVEDALEDLQIFSSDGTFSEFEIGAFAGTNEASFVLPASEAELNFWSISEYEDTEDPDAAFEAAFAFNEGVQVDEDNTEVVIDERGTFPRAVDTSAVSEDEPFNVADYLAFLHASTTNSDLAFGVGGFGELSHFTELSQGSTTNISTSWTLVPDDETGDGGALDASRIYTVVGATETLSSADPDFEIDPDTFATENMTLHRLDEEFYDTSTFLSPADQETFPGSPPFAIREDIGEDREEISWIRNAAGQYEHVFGAGEFGDYRYIESPWSPEVGETYETDVNGGPMVPDSDWQIDDRLNLRMSFAAGPGDRTRMAGTGSGPDDQLRLALDGDTVIDEPVAFPSVTIDGPIGPDTDVAVELEGNSMVNRNTTTRAKYEGNSDDEAPPNVESVDILGYEPNEPITDEEITLKVELDAPGDLEPRLFRAYYGHNTHDRPTEDWRNWDRGDTEQVADDTFHVDVDVLPGTAELDIAFRALDENGNEMEAATLGAATVDIDHSELSLSSERTPVGAGGMR